MFFYGPTPNSFDDLEHYETQAQTQAMSDAEKETRLAAHILMDCGTLKAGTYPVKNIWKSIFPEGKCEVGIDTAVTIDFGTNDVINFTLTEKHLKLLKHANRNLYGFDIKRPYGDMTYYHLDMCDALGIKVPRNKNDDPDFTPQQLDELDKLHGEMLFAVQVFLQKATLKPGTFACKNHEWSSVTK